MNHLYCYVDESGDPGPYKAGEKNSGSRHFILSALIVPQHQWIASIERWAEFRRNLKSQYGLKVRTELHAAELIRFSKLTEYGTIRKSNRINILKSATQQIPLIFRESKIINICFDKAKVSEKVNNSILKTAYDRLINRLETYLTIDAKGYCTLFCDGTVNNETKRLLRKMRVYNPLPSHIRGYYPKPITRVLEDPVMLDSKDSAFIQACDVISYSLFMKEFPKPSLKKFNLDLDFKNLEPMLIKKASSSDPWGIVRK